jgi:hypothetical protein
MGIFKKLFSRQSLKESVDSKSLGLLLESADFYQNNIPLNFYSKLIELYTVNTFNKHEPKELAAYHEFKNYVEDFSKVYGNILAASFEKVITQELIKKLNELENTHFELPGIKPLLASCFYQPIRKTRQDISKTKDIELINEFEKFHEEVRNIFERIMIITQ